MGWLAIVGSFLQLILLVLPRIFSSVDVKKEEGKILYEQGKKAIKERSASDITRVFDQLRASK
jgi:hypothetical protein